MSRDEAAWARHRRAKAGLGTPSAPPPARVVFAHVPPRAGHAGLGVNSEHHAGALSRLGYPAVAVAAEGGAPPEARVVVVQGPWIPPDRLRALAEARPASTFVVRIHSQAAFLGADPTAGAVAAYRGLAPNVVLSFNGRSTARALVELGWPVLYLPNLYDNAEAPPERLASYVPDTAPEATEKRRNNSTGVIPTLRIASFGSIRVGKHHPTAALAALLVARKLGRRLNFSVNSGRQEGGNLHFLRSLFDGRDDAELVEVPWGPWREFRRRFAAIDLSFQLSASESFNLVTADATWAGCPSVVGPAIDWAPRDWTAPIDDPEEAARIALDALATPGAAGHWRSALEAHQDGAKALWRDFLASKGVTPRPAPRPPGGVGTELTKLLSWFGEGAGCGCKARAARLDAQGVDWCEANVPIVVGLLEEGARERGLPFVEWIARGIVAKAIRRAKEAQCPTPPSS